MDNIVQNINLDSIIPSTIAASNPKEIGPLISSIKQYGILEPLLVRPNNGKYEIIIGNKRYQAAKILGLKTVPALVKNVDDEVFNQYKMINAYDQKQHGKFINQQQFINQEVEEFSNNQGNQNQVEANFNRNSRNISTPPLDTTPISAVNKNTDIINLSELNKEEYERKDVNMNNNQMMNNVMNNDGGIPQANQPMQEPTFGGRFFPSLEDEPTNMNMGGGNIVPPATQPQMNNNLIDLTDISMEPGNQPNIPNPEAVSMTPNTNPAMMNTTMEPISNISENIQPINPMSQNIAPTNNANNVVNVENLQQPNTPVVEPTPINTIPTTPLPQETPQFDMSQNIAPPEFLQNQPQTAFQQPIPENNYDRPTNTIEQPTIPVYNQPIEPQVAPTPMATAVVPEPVVPEKDVTPVLNTIKNLVTDLQAFGYNIMMNEEDLGTSIKLVIEVEK